MPPIQLAPINPPLGVNPAYCVGKQTTLVMKEKVWYVAPPPSLPTTSPFPPHLQNSTNTLTSRSLSGDTFHIVDENNREVVQCRGQTFSLSDRKEFADASGRPLFSLRTRLLSLHKSFYAEGPGGDILFEVKGKFSSK